MNNTSQSSALSTQSYQPANWLITGGCGFIGTSLIKKLVKEGNCYIRVLDNLSVGTKDDLARVCRFTEIQPSSLSTQSSSPATQSSILSPQHSRVELVPGDILDEELALKVASGMDVIVHLAANTGVPQSIANPRKDCLLNVIGTFNYLEAARHNKVGRFIFASSGAPAGEVEPPIHEELPAHPVSPYGASKLAGEGYCSAYFRSFGVETVCLRFGNVYGPGSGHKTSVVAKFIRKAMAGEPLEIYGDGNQTRDFIFIEDLVEAICLAATKPNIGGEVFQIATSKETTVRQMVEILLPLLAKKGITDLQVIHSEKRQGDVMRNFSDTSKAENVLGWKSKWPLEIGLQATVDSFLGEIRRKK